MAGVLAFPSLAHGETAAFVDIRGDSTIAVEAVARQPADQVLLLFGDRSERLVMVHRIRKITDTSGADRTRFVIDGWGTVGVFPAGYVSPVHNGSPAVKPILIGLGVGVAMGLVFVALVAAGVATGTDP